MKDWISYSVALISALSTIILGLYSRVSTRRKNTDSSDFKRENLYAGELKGTLAQINQLTADKLDLVNQIIELRQTIGNMKLDLEDKDNQINILKGRLAELGHPVDTLGSISDYKNKN